MLLTYVTVDIEYTHVHLISFFSYCDPKHFSSRYLKLVVHISNTIKMSPTKPAPVHLQSESARLQTAQPGHVQPMGKICASSSARSIMLMLVSGSTKLTS